MAKGGTLADNSFEVHLAANFFLKVKLLLRQPVLQIGDFAIGESVIDSNRHLVRDLRQERDFFRIKSILVAPGHRENA